MTELRLSVLKLIQLTEKYAAVEPALRLYKAALNAGMYELDRGHLEVSDLLFRWLPLDVQASTGKQVANLRVPTARIS